MLKVQRRQRLRRELALLKQDARKPITRQQWQLVEGKRRRKPSPTLDAATSPAKRLAAAPVQRRADGDELAILVGGCMRAAQDACVPPPAVAAAAKRQAAHAACPSRKPRWVEREEAARPRKPRTSLDRDLDAYFFGKEAANDMQ